MEAALVTILIGVGVVATMQLLAAGSMSNAYANEMTTAVNLANNVHEIALGLPFYDPETPTNQPPDWSTPESGGALGMDDLLDLDGKTFSPPLDARRLPISLYANWSQVVQVQSVANDSLTSVRPDTTSEPTAKVTVSILHNGRQVYQSSWVAVAPAR
jgi:hypothetical protein